MAKTRLGLSLVWMALASGCGDSPEEQCKDLFGAICKKVIMCTEELTNSMAPEGFESECVEQVEQSGVCSKAVDVSSSYDTCMDELDDASCDDFLAIDHYDRVRLSRSPASCKGAIEFEEAWQPTGQPACTGLGCL